MSSTASETGEDRNIFPKSQIATLHLIVTDFFFHPHAASSSMKQPLSIFKPNIRAVRGGQTKSKENRHENV